MVIGHQAAGQLFIKENILGVVHTHGEGGHLVENDDEDHAQHQEPVFVLQHSQNGGFEGHGLLGFLHFGNGFPGAEVNNKADYKGNGGQNRRHENPAPLAAAHGVHDIQAEHGEDHLHQPGKDHADGIGRGPAGRVVGHIDRHGVDGAVKQSKGHGHGKVVGHKDIDRLAQRAAVRHGEKQHIGRRQQHRAAEHPGPGRAALGVGVVDQVPGPQVADAVKQLAHQNNQAHQPGIHAQHVGIEEGQEGQSQGVDGVGGQLVEGIGQLVAQRDGPVRGVHGAEVRSRVLFLGTKQHVMHSLFSVFLRGIFISGSIAQPTGKGK